MSGTQAIGRRPKGRLHGLGWGVARTVATTAVPQDPLDRYPARAAQKQWPIGRQGAWKKEAQAECAEQMYRLAFGHPAVEAISWWGLSDRDSWQRGDGLLTADYAPKPVYTRLKQLITQEWRTRTTAATDGGGEVAFRGFYGRHSIEVRTSDGTTRAFSLLLSKKSGKENRLLFVVRQPGPRRPGRNANR